ncbi:MAG: transglutaminase family protein [Candidatus Dormibacteria bacterium]
MSELAAPILALLAVAAALALVPRMRLAPNHGQSIAGGLTPPRDLVAARWVSLALAVMLSLCVAGTLGTTVLGTLGGIGLLAAATGVLTAATFATWLPNRALGISATLAAGAGIGILLAERVAAVVGANGTIPSLLNQDLNGSDPVAFQLLTLLLLCWGAGAWIGWLVIRERAGAVACALPIVILVADLVNVEPSLQGAPFWPVAGASVTGLVLVGLTHQERQLARWVRLGVPCSGAQPRRGVVVTLGTAALITVVALLLPPLSSANISQRFFHSGPQVTKTSQANRTAAISGFSTSVVPGGPIREVKLPVLSYRTSAPGGTVYLRGVALSEFSNGNWYEAPSSTLTTKAGAFLPYDGAASQGTTASELGRHEVSLSVTYIGAGATEVPDLLYAGSPLTSPTSPGPYEVAGQLNGRQLLQVNTITPKSGVSAALPQSQSLTTYGSISVATAAQLESAGTNYPAWVQADTALPPESNFEDVNQIAADAVAMSGGATDPYQMALNIQDALRSQEFYTLDPPPTPAGLWPIVYFLNDSHRGYCQYFASAMGAMLRTLGIPSRLVSGFGPGEEGRLPNGQWLITEADAHTWVQVYFPTYGWVNFEPTPDGFYQPIGAAVAPAGSSQPTTGAAPHPGVRSTGVAGSPVKPRAARRGSAIGLPAALVALAIVLLVLFIAVMAWASRVRTPRQLRRRLELPVRLSQAADPKAQTLTELALACGDLSPAGDSDTRAHLIDLAVAADRLAFSGPTSGAGLETLHGWSEVRSRYPGLLWHGWRRGRSNLDSATRPMAHRVRQG